MKSPYSETVMEHFRHPHNVGEIEDADGKAIEGSPACGDMVSVYINVDPKAKKISDIKFESYGCASNIATGSIITELAKGKTLEEAMKITPQSVAAELEGLPKNKFHCSNLGAQALHKAIQDYLKKQKKGGKDNGKQA